MQVDSGPNVAHVPLPVLPSVPPPPDSYDEHRGTNTPIIIDNGSTTFRWGFADFGVPRFGPNAISKYKERKTNKPLLLFGEAIDVESGAKAQTRTAWEGDVLLNFDALVCSIFGSMQGQYDKWASRRRRTPWITHLSILGSIHRL